MCHGGDSVTPDERTLHCFMTQTMHRPDSTEKSSQEGRQVQRTFPNTASPKPGVTFIPPNECGGPDIDHAQVPGDDPENGQVIHAKTGPFQARSIIEIIGRYFRYVSTFVLRLERRVPSIHLGASAREASPVGQATRRCGANPKIDTLLTPSSSETSRVHFRPGQMTNALNDR